MGPKLPFLNVSRAFIVVVIQARLAKTNDFTMSIGEIKQLVRGNILFGVGVVRMDTDSTEYIVIVYGYPQYLLELTDTGADSQHVADPGVTGNEQGIFHNILFFRSF